MKFTLSTLLLFVGLFSYSQNFESAKEKIKDKYQYIAHPENNIVVFREHNGKSGLMDSLCNITADSNFDYIHISCNGWIEAGLKNNGKMKRGYIDKNGNIKISIIYDIVYNPCKSNLCIVGIDNKNGVVDSLNNIKIPIEYTGITDANEETFIVEKNKRFAIFGADGNPLTNFDFIDTERYYDGAVSVILPDNSTTLIDLKGNILFTPLKGYRLGNCKKGICAISNVKTGKIGFIDKSGKIIIPCEYDNAEQANELLKLQKNKKWGLYNFNHEAITEIKYEYIFSSVNNLYIVKDKNWGVINMSGKDIIPITYKHISLHAKKYFITENNEGNYGVFDSSGVNTIPFNYLFFRLWKDKVFAEKSGKPIILNLETGTEITIDADQFKHPEHLLYEKWDKQVFVKNGKYGVLSIENKVLIPSKYDSLQPIYVSGEFMAKQNEKYGIIDSKGNIKQPFVFDKIFLRKEVAELSAKNKKKVYHRLTYRDYDIRFNYENDND